MTSDKIAITKYMEQCEKEGRFDVHTTPPALELALPVDENYNYLQTGFVNLFKKCFAHSVDFFVEKKIVRDLFGLEIKGLENLEGVPNSVVVCNHVHMFDCVIVRQAYKRKNIYCTAAEFNNRSDFLGFLMRYNEMMPFSSNHRAQRSLNHAIETILTAKDGHLLVFPEASEWWYYKKPRPFKPGAFHYAVKHNVPVQPMFITFTDTDKVDKEGNPLPKATLHICPAVYPKVELSKKENEEYLSCTVYRCMKIIYEDFYGIPLRFTCDVEKLQQHPCLKQALWN